jgi:hypothetical protein
MNTDIWTSRWWEIAVVALAANSVVFGVIAVSNDHTDWAIATGFAPAALLVVSLVLRGRWRVGATAILIPASLAAASWFWMVYPAVLAGIIIVGGFSNGYIGPTRPQPHPAA